MKRLWRAVTVTGVKIILSSRELESYGQTTIKLAGEASEKFSRFLKTLNIKDGNYWPYKDMIFDVAEGLIRQYGGAASLNAAEFFEKQTGISNALASEWIDLDSLDRTIRYAIAANRYDALGADPLPEVNKNISRQTKNHAHQTMVDNARKNKVKFARVPAGAKTCAFCMMLASRGFVYVSKQTAGEMMQFHNDCDCQIIAGVEDVEGYDPESLQDQYLESRKRVEEADKADKDANTTKDILAQMRKDYSVK